MMKKIFEGKKSLLIGLVILALALTGRFIYGQYKDHMLISRGGFTATLLQDGTVLIVGGLHNKKQTDLAEVYNPKTHFSHFVGRLNIPREGHESILLDNGKVLIVGGRNNGIFFIKQAEIYDPTTHKFSLTDELKGYSSSQKLTLSKLNDGRVFIVSEGWTNRKRNGIQQSNNIYNPKTNKFSLAAFSKVGSFNHTANVLPDGNVLIAASGLEGLKNNEIEIYNSKLDKFVQGPDMIEPRIQSDSITLQDGKVLFTNGAGCSDKLCLVSEVYNPILNKFEYAGKMKQERKIACVRPVLLDDGRVYIVGNDAYKLVQPGWHIIKPKKPTCEIYDPNTKTFKFTDVCLKPLKENFIPVLANDGELLIFGGWYADIPAYKRISDEKKRRIEIINTKEIK